MAKATATLYLTHICGNKTDGDRSDPIHPSNAIVAMWKWKNQMKGIGRSEMLKAVMF